MVICARSFQTSVPRLRTKVTLGACGGGKLHMLVVPSSAELHWCRPHNKCLGNSHQVGGAGKPAKSKATGSASQSSEVDEKRRYRRFLVRRRRVVEVQSRPLTSKPPRGVRPNLAGVRPTKLGFGRTREPDPPGTTKSNPAASKSAGGADAWTTMGTCTAVQHKSTQLNGRIRRPLAHAAAAREAMTTPRGVLATTRHNSPQLAATGAG